MFDQSTNSEDYQQVKQTIAVMAKIFPDNFWIQPHKHTRAQLIYATKGIMHVTIAGDTCIVPLGRAVWVPVNMSHELKMIGQVSMRTLYIKPEAVTWLTTYCKVIDVSRLLRELILSMTEDSTKCRRDCLSKLMLIELKNASALPVGVPMPQNNKLLRICEYLLDHPESAHTLEYWAAEVGASARTLARYFRAETGCSYLEWRQQVRLSKAFHRLNNGQPIKQIAAELGYQSTSAFIAMFRRALGFSPRHYSGIISRTSPIRIS